MKRYVAKGPRPKEELQASLENFWRNEMTVELCNRYIDHCFKVAPVCIAMKGKATGDIPSRLFSERSTGKSFHHFANSSVKGVENIIVEGVTFLCSLYFLSTTE
ncbi:hypothetical protein DPMN_013441 [Dreissena polymorpha]|uniref:Uncharacterized protein n=1 Tax=Dreissena polymorpha TaxID=45954 RepID=A0A9D4N4A1_DREPO|nr:hypothetical protein DPMN_013253 [Dreissena polymorpha]KAH3889387.1 hypothetical protein DPMN_013441 [Dreissena polymorpha]